MHILLISKSIALIIWKFLLLMFHQSNFFQTRTNKNLLTNYNDSSQIV